MFLETVKTISLKSLFPKDCATRPTVPILKKPKLHKIIVITEVDILIAVKNFSLPKFYMTLKIQ